VETPPRPPLASEGGVESARWRAVECRLDALEHRAQVAVHLFVVDSNDAQTHGCEEAITLRIELATVEVNSAVDLHHQPSLGAIEVGDEPIDNELSSKPDSEPALAEPLPKPLFRVHCATSHGVIAAT
jgi:hypothetical protein